MPKVIVPVEDFQAGDFPPVCALTGAPATTTHPLLVVRRGVVGGAQERRRRLLGRVPSRVVGAVPLSDRAARRTVVLDRARAVLVAVAVVGFVVGIFSSLTLLLSSSALAALLGASLFLSVGGELDRTGTTVTLLHVHPRFADAVGGAREVRSRR